MLPLLAHILSREFVEGHSAERLMGPGCALRGTGNTTRKDKVNERSRALGTGAREQWKQSETIVWPWGWRWGGKWKKVWLSVYFIG